MHITRSFAVAGVGVHTLSVPRVSCPLVSGMRHAALPPGRVRSLLFLALHYAECHWWIKDVHWKGWRHMTAIITSHTRPHFTRSQPVTPSVPRVVQPSMEEASVFSVRAAGAAMPPPAACNFGHARAQALPERTLDPILGLTQLFNADNADAKLNVGVGAYRDDEGSPYYFRAVRRAETELLASPTASKEYLPICGLSDLRVRGCTWQDGLCDVFHMLRSKRQPSCCSERSAKRCARGALLCARRCLALGRCGWGSSCCDKGLPPCLPPCLPPSAVGWLCCVTLCCAERDPACVQ